MMALSFFTFQLSWAASYDLLLGQIVIEIMLRDCRSSSHLIYYLCNEKPIYAKSRRLSCLLYQQSQYRKPSIKRHTGISAAARTASTSFNETT